MILIVDFGSQTTHLIGRRLQEQGIATVTISPQEVGCYLPAEKNLAGIILSGGPQSVYVEGAATLPLKLFEVDIPILGICYGWQLMAHLLGGCVAPGTAEFGVEPILFSTNLFSLPTTHFSVVMSHGDSVTSLPRGFTAVASSERVAYAAAADEFRHLYGLQFHPEASHSEFGNDILYHFASAICKAPSSPSHRLHHITIDERIKAIREEVGDEEVVIATSGGVDSSVAAALIARAIGPRLHPVYVESGLMRPNTSSKVHALFPNNLTIVEASERFVTELKGISDPEEKRKLCGKLYVELFAETAASRWPKARFLAQGTIYSDWIESNGTNSATTIKSHHNVGGLPEKMPFLLLEPLRYLYKDEVRSLGTELGLPKFLIAQHPFPGPGYAVRIVGEVTRERLERVRLADAIVVEEIERAEIEGSLFQCFAILTGSYSTAVVGDQRAFGEVAALRAYTSEDVMTAEVAELPYPLLARIVRRIISEVPHISRVVYDITPKPPATMEWL